MSINPDRQPSDDKLDQLARKLFAEVRGENRGEKAGRIFETAGVMAGEVFPGVPDWLLDAGGDDAGGDSDG